ncbi:9728_t:CDS:2 [Paraglomus brasilianum]|uniref:9728_t:CDS:1 n=1 Tax=Paraglomus brasilianum TaxID=144538 RepID=A0A9N9B7Y1_9GLOM|nr:9728_t:CDS:2 [Paraglomus brasilianum]
MEGIPVDDSAYFTFDHEWSLLSFLLYRQHGRVQGHFFSLDGAAVCVQLLTAEEKKSQSIAKFWENVASVEEHTTNVTQSVFQQDHMEYFGAETFIDEDPHNSKPISYKYNLFREMKDQLDRLLKRLKFTEETIKRLCQYRIGTTLRSVPESLAVLKDELRLKHDLISVLSVVKEVKKVALRTRPEGLFTLEDLPEITTSPQKISKQSSLTRYLFITNMHSVP